MRQFFSWLEGATFVAALAFTLVVGFGLCARLDQSRIEAGYIENNGKLYHVAPATVVPLQEKMEKLCDGENVCHVPPQ